MIKKFDIIDDIISPEFIEHKNCRCNVDFVLNNMTVNSTDLREEDILNIAVNRILNHNLNKRAKEIRKKKKLKKTLISFEKIEDLREFLRKNKKIFNCDMVCSINPHKPKQKEL